MFNETRKSAGNASPKATAAPQTGRRQRRRHWRKQRGQSLIVAVMVLFLLLFLGGVFIALIASNIRSAQRAGDVNSASYYAEAGIHYLDQQLTSSPEGADWRPAPDDPLGDANGDGDPTDINREDPDYFWLQDPYNPDGTIKRDPRTGEMIGGYTRVNFGGPVPGKGTSGGRALVRVTYLPRLGDPAQDPLSNPVSKYIKLEAIGRVGRVDGSDPTTWGNTEGLGLRQELVAYKAIGITDYIRFVTNKDNKTNPVNLGSPFPSYDRTLPGESASDPRDMDLNGDNQVDMIVREIESVYEGPIRVNAPLTFYGYSLFTLNPNRNDAIEVAGPITMNNVDPAANAVADFQPTAANPNPGRVTVNGAYIFPSLSPSFTTLNGLVRDAPTSGDPNRIPIGTNNTDAPNRNLRGVARLAPPTIDAEIGDRGLTRYRALTRNAAAMPPGFMTANPLGGGINPVNAGFFGWGEGLYVNNAREIHEDSVLAGAQSLRSEWLNPRTATGGFATNWKSESLYVPPAVTITLTPRYMILTQTPDRGRQYLRDNNGQRINSTRIIRYTDSTINTAHPSGQGKPFAGIPYNVPSYEGYPAVKGTDNVYRGDFVIYAEGNVRIRGVVGGIDPETQAMFLRHLTVVAGGTIYVDGNLLRDNITDAMASSGGVLGAIKGKSSIALLAKDYVTVNTTQFLSPTLTGDDNPAPGGSGDDSVVTLGAGQGLNLGFALGPIQPMNVPLGNTPPTDSPWYADANIEQEPITAGSIPPGAKLFLFVRQRASDDNPNTEARSYLNVFLNKDAYGYPAPIPNPGLLNFAYGNKGAFSLYGGYTTAEFTDPTFRSLPVTDASFLSQAFEIDPAQIYPFLKAPYSGSLATPLGLENQLRLEHDPSAGSTANLDISRVGIAPLDVRIEAFIYAQEGSFFIIPGPWFNPDPNDTLENYLATGKRASESAGGPRRVNPRFPFYKQPMDIRITVFGTIAENLPAEIGDQGAWLEKWGWVPRFYGSTGMNSAAGTPPEREQGAAIPTVHGYPDTNLPSLFGTGEGIVYVFNDNGILPYFDNGDPIRPNPYRPFEPLPIAPRLPVAPGLLFFGERPIR